MASSVKKRVGTGEQATADGSDSFDEFLEAVAEVPERSSSALARLAPGTQVTANIELVRKLDEGGMGSVWIAHHQALATEVAVKFISPALLESGKDVARRFTREARAAAQIKSPHAVQIFDHGWMDDGVPFIVMELLEGEDLRERLERGPLSLDDTQQLLRQVAEVLTRAHATGLVHRDIKPNNLFLIESGVGLFVKVLDFGLAKRTHVPQQSHVTRSGVTLGTPDYMSPEQINSSKDVGPEADLWALAVTAYQALSGQVPFRGETVGSIWVKITTEDFEPVSSRRPHLPVAIDAWFRRALDKDPSRRFESANAMVEAFEAALEGEDISLDDADISSDGVEQAPSSSELAETVQREQSDPPPVPAGEAPARSPGTLGGAANTLGSDPPPMRANTALRVAVFGAVAGIGIAAVSIMWDTDEVVGTDPAATPSASALGRPAAATTASGAAPSAPDATARAEGSDPSSIAAPPASASATTLASASPTAPLQVAPKQPPAGQAAPATPAPATPAPAKPAPATPAPAKPAPAEVPWLIERR